METEEINSQLPVFLSNLCSLFVISQSLETALKYCNYFFTSTFVIEASLKLVAFGFRRFFKDRYKDDVPSSVETMTIRADEVCDVVIIYDSTVSV